MDEWGSIPAGKGFFSLCQGVQTGSEAHKVPYPMGSGGGGSYAGGKAAGV